MSYLPTLKCFPRPKGEPFCQVFLYTPAGVEYYTGSLEGIRRDLSTCRPLCLGVVIFHCRRATRKWTYKDYEFFGKDSDKYHLCKTTDTRGRRKDGTSIFKTTFLFSSPKGTKTFRHIPKHYIKWEEVE